jgi:DNA-directed RNA polymerase subunit M/transcription elongation factor TFIIS
MEMEKGENMEQENKSNIIETFQVVVAELFTPQPTAKTPKPAPCLRITCPNCKIQDYMAAADLKELEFYVCGVCDHEFEYTAKPAEMVKEN